MQCKLNFQSKPKSFQTKQSKVNYSLSFLKGTALDYFKPYLADDLANKPGWLNDFELFVEELLINFSPYARMKWYISTNLTHSTDSGTSFRKLTNAIGNEKANFCKRSRSLPSKI